MTNRRSFLKSLITAPVALAPISHSFAQEIDPNLKWDKEADVIVVGFRGAGAAAAIASAQEGAKTLVLEKMPRGDGNTACAGGGFIIPKNADDAFVYLKETFTLSDSDLEEELVRAFCNEAVKTKEYFESLDKSIQLRKAGNANFPQLPCSETIVKYAVKGPKTGGMNLFNALKNVVEKQRTEIWYNAPAAKLLKKDNVIVGVQVRKDGKDLNVKANRGVILTTGGYEYDHESLQNYCQGTKVAGLGNPGNAGDGMKMAQAVGAKLWHMNAYSCPLGMTVPGLKTKVLWYPLTTGYVWVDQDGKRFTNEGDLDFHSALYGVNKFDAVGHRYPAIPCYAVFDEQARLAAPLTHQRFGYATVIEGYKWDKDCAKEIEAGIVKKAATLKELASLINVPPENLERTISQWNTDVKNGSDTNFGRRMKKVLTEKEKQAGIEARVLSTPIEKGPYYAVELVPALLNTQGGPKRNVNGQVLNALDEPIPHLFCAGELGSIWGTIYQGSSNIAECLVFGRIAGRQAAQTKNWQ